jgi:hypothetical protein
MLRTASLFAVAVAALTLTTASKAQAYGACHAGYTHVGPNGVQHVGYTAASGPGGSAYHSSGSASGGAYHYGASSGGAAAGGYHYSYGSSGGAAGGYHYGAAYGGAGVYRGY